MQRGNTMLTIMCNKKELQELVLQNREEHRGIFEAAMEGWYEHCIRAIRTKGEALLDRREPQMVFNYPAPQDHTEDYDRILAMLEMHTGEEIELSEEQYAMYAMDDWGWKQRFVMDNAGYTDMGANASYGKFLKRS